MDIKIENYTDFENVTIAEFKEALANAETMALEAGKNGDLKTALNCAKIYFELNKLLGKKISLGSGLGYVPRGHSK